MSNETRAAVPYRDARDTLLRTKYFSMRPQPLERWLWEQGLSQAAERVFWLHWDEGARAGDWCSQIPISRVALACRIDPATVTRAYQHLRRLGLLRREDPGRDPANPFCQATAVTEVRLPRELLAVIAAAPDRPAATARHPIEAGPAAEVAPPPPAAPPATEAYAPKTLRESRALYARLSDAERARFQEATRLRSADLDFDPDSRLRPEEQAYLRASLQALGAAPASTAPRRTPPAGRIGAGPALTPLELARVRRRVLDLLPGDPGLAVAREVAWSLEAGALARFGALHGLNIALKKIREGAWSRPNRMPPQWLCRAFGPETCSAA